MRALTAAVLLCPMLAGAAPVRLLMLGGGAKPEDAAKVLENWSKIASAMPLVPAAGFPKIVESATVKGLKPGFHVVLAGACADSESEGLRVLETQRQAYGGSYFRPVEWDGAAPCPTLQKGWTIKSEAKTGGIEAFAARTGGDLRAWVVELRGADGALIDLRGADRVEAAKLGGDAPMGDALGKASTKGEELILEYAFYSPGCTTPNTQFVEQRFSLKGGKVLSKWKLGKMKPGECD